MPFCWVSWRLRQIALINTLFNMLFIVIIYFLITPVGGGMQNPKVENIKGVWAEFSTPDKAVMVNCIVSMSYIQYLLELKTRPRSIHGDVLN